MTKKKSGFSSANSVTLRLFPGHQEDSASFELVKVSGNPKSINIDSLTQIKSDEGEIAVTEVETFDGYFPEDGYDYSQHLREINADRFVEANRKTDLNPIVGKNRELAEVMSALETVDDGSEADFDSEIIRKLGPLDERTRIGLLWGEEHVDEYLCLPTERLMALQNRLMERERTAVVSTNEQSDKEFEAFFSREFDDVHIGGLSAEEVVVEDEEEYEALSEDEYSESSEESGDVGETLDQIRAEGLEETKRFVLLNEALQQSVMDCADDLTDIILVPVSNVPEWDCESVLSTRSTIYNHPGKIFRPPRRLKETPTIAEEVELEVVTPEMKSVSTFRRKDETSEERRARKQAVKEFQREHRQAKQVEKAKVKEASNNAKLMSAIHKRNNFGDIPSGVPKFSM